MNATPIRTVTELKAKLDQLILMPDMKVEVAWEGHVPGDGFPRLIHDKRENTLIIQCDGHTLGFEWYAQQPERFTIL